MTAALVRRLIPGMAGAVTLTALHEWTRRRVARPPRLDLRGMRALRAWPRVNAMSRGRRRRVALVGDLLFNSIYFAAVPAPTASQTWARAAALGGGAGLGAVVLPRPLGLGTPPGADSLRTRLLTVALYTAGAAAAAGLSRACRDRLHGGA